MYKTLLLSSKRQAGIEIAKTLLPKLIKLELHSLAQITALDLAFHYSSIAVSASLTKKYEKIADVQLEIVKAEARLRKYHNRVGFICNTRESFTDNIIKEFTETAKHSLPLLRLHSNHIKRLVYSIVVCRYIVAYDYENIIKYCNEALASFPDGHPNIWSLQFAFLHKQLPALVALERFQEAKEIAKTACHLVPVGRFNWHLALIKRIRICLYSEDYQEAYELYKAHTQQKCPFENLNEYWNILKGYLYFLIQRGHIGPYGQERFNLGKFLNQMPLYSRDKAGHNISILIIQILIRIATRTVRPHH